ncbi:MAG: YcfL family protein [Victivallaceae bacterium]|nr:YcfL family protein [Victivallaceae bacterium]
MRKSIIAVAIAAIGMLFAGCQNTVNTMENEEKAMRPAIVDTKHFVSDSFCNNRLKLLSFRKSISQGGVMVVQAELRSERYGFFPEIWSWWRNDNPYHVLYRFEWLDSNGMNVATAGSDWVPVIFIPGETKFLRGVAPNSRCNDFVLSVVEDGRNRN